MANNVIVSSSPPPLARLQISGYIKQLTQRDKNNPPVWGAAPGVGGRRPLMRAWASDSVITRVFVFENDGTIGFFWPVTAP